MPAIFGAVVGGDDPMDADQQAVTEHDEGHEQPAAVVADSGDVMNQPGGPGIEGRKRNRILMSGKEVTRGVPVLGNESPAVEHPTRTI